jgi:hypothetical protein
VNQAGGCGLIHDAMRPDLIVYQFSRERVERGDFSHFLSLYGSDRLPQGLALKLLLGRLVFCVEGYDVDPREIYLIDEVRWFYSAFHDAWPYWLYFCDLHQDVLKKMVSCCLQTFTAIKLDGQAKCAVEYDLFELVQLIAHDLPFMNGMCERAGMTEQEIFERSREVFQYFGLPFEASAPEAGGPG